MNLQSPGPEASKIRDMFRSIAGGYDRANNWLSVGIHHWWRRRVVEWSGARAGQSVLDCATGTGDLAIEFRKVVGANGRVVGTDFCPEMLEHAPAKARKLFADGIEFSVADVTALPFGDANFDIASISFGIRNVQNPAQGLRELGRVVKPRGVVMVLEFGQPSLPGLKQGYAFYSKQILPKLGGLITGRPEAYKYLEASSAKFPCGEEFVALLRSTQMFSEISYRPLSGGIAYIYRAVRG